MRTCTLAALRSSLRWAARSRATAAAASQLRPRLTAASALTNGMAESDKLGATPGIVSQGEQESAMRGARLAAAAERSPATAGEPAVGDKPAPRLGHHSPTLGGSPALTTGGRGMLTSASADAGAASSSQYARVYLGVSDEKGQRGHMEDRHKLIPKFATPGADPALPCQFAAVYDGHSSHHGSEHASRRVHKYIAAQKAVQDFAAGRDDPPRVEAALKEAFQAADQEIVDTAVQNGKRYGTTAVCALRAGNSLYVAHAGDSRAVLCRDGKGLTLTRDHKPASVPEERERIESHGGHIVYEDDRVVSNPEGQRRSRLNMSRALGDPDFKQPRRLVEAEPDVARLELRPGSDAFLLLGSDGLFEQLSVQQAVDITRKALSSLGKPSDAAADAAADALVQKALQAGTSDNVTALLMLIDWQH